MVARAVALVVAITAAAWFAVGIRQAHDTDAAAGIVTGSAPVGAARASHVRALLYDAGQLNPDRTVDLLRAELALRQGDRAQARAIALAVTRSEPQNLQAWLAYGTASSNDPQAFQLALRHARGLAPAVGRSG